MFSSRRRTGPREGEIQIDCRRNGYHFRRAGWLLNTQQEKRAKTTHQRFFINYILTHLPSVVFSFDIQQQPRTHRHDNTNYEHDETTRQDILIDWPNVSFPLFLHAFYVSCSSIKISIGLIFYTHIYTQRCLPLSWLLNVGSLLELISLLSTLCLLIFFVVELENTKTNWIVEFYSFHFYFAFTTVLLSLDSSSGLGELIAIYSER